MKKSISSEFPFESKFIDVKGSKMHFLPMKVNSGTNALQAMGGGITYAKRYAIAALLGLSVDNLLPFP